MLADRDTPRSTDLASARASAHRARDAVAEATTGARYGRKLVDHAVAVVVRAVARLGYRHTRLGTRVDGLVGNDRGVGDLGVGDLGIGDLGIRHLGVRHLGIRNFGVRHLGIDPGIAALDGRNAFHAGRTAVRDRLFFLDIPRLEPRSAAVHDQEGEESHTEPAHPPSLARVWPSGDPDRAPLPSLFRNPHQVMTSTGAMAFSVLATAVGSLALAQPLPPAPPTPVDTSTPTGSHSPPPAVTPTPPDAPPASAPTPAPVPAPPAATAPIEPTPPPPEDPRPDSLSRRDAHADRNVLSPTAETNPKGSFYLTSYEIVFLQVGFSPTDDTQVSVSGMPPLGEDPVVPLDLSVKTVVFRSPSLNIAALGSATGIFGSPEVNGFLGRAGFAATLCDPPGQCLRTLSLSSNIFLLGPASLVFSGAGATIRVSKTTSFLLEVDSVVPLGEAVGENHGIMGAAGVRFSGRRWGVDLALLRGGSAGSEPTPFIPFIAATYRHVP